MNMEVIRQIAVEANALVKQGMFGKAVGALGQMAQAAPQFVAKAAPTLGKAAPQAGKTLMQRFTPGARTMGAAGAAGLGGAVVGDALGVQNHEDSYNPLRQMAAYTAGRTANPATWFAPRSHQQVHDTAFRQWEALNNQANSQIDAAMMKGDHELANRIMAQQQGGSFTGSQTPSPFGGNMGQFARHVMGVNEGDQDRLNLLQTRMDARTAQDPNFNRAPFEAQIAALNKRMDQAGQVGGMKSRMNQSGSPGGHWLMGGRPGGVQNWALNPNDFRRDPSHNVWEEVLRSSGGNPTR